MSFLPSLIILGAAVLFALRFTVTRPSPPERTAERRAAAWSLAIATVVQAAHFVEEALTNLHELFPGLVGLPAMAFSSFATFNLAWIAIWLASVPGLLAGRAWAFFAAWFLAIAGVINGIGHPLLAIAEGGYFPGLVSSPFVGMASLWLWHRLRHASDPAR